MEKVVSDVLLRPEVLDRLVSGGQRPDIEKAPDTQRAQKESRYVSGRILSKA